MTPENAADTFVRLNTAYAALMAAAEYTDSAEIENICAALRTLLLIPIRLCRAEMEQKDE